MVRVSIIVPIYKAESYIERCVTSLMQQTMKDGIEFIFINDCSPDKSMDLLYGVISKYPQRKGQIVVENNEKNVGIANVRKKGIEIASGEYVGWCDSDDWVEPEMYQRMCEATHDASIDIVVANYYIEEMEQLKVEHHVSRNPNEALANSWRKNHLPLGLPFQLIRKPLIEYAISQIYPTKQGEDTYMMRYIYMKAQSIEFLKDAFYHYDRTNQASVTHNSDICLEQWYMHKKNIDKIASLLLGGQNGGGKYRKSVNALKYYRKCQYRSVFRSIRDYYKTYSECYVDINSILNTSIYIRKKVFLLYNIYPLFWLYFRKRWNR